MPLLQSAYTMGQEVKLGDITAKVSGIWFDGIPNCPKIELTWFAGGDVKSTWVREGTLIGMQRD